MVRGTGCTLLLLVSPFSAFKVPVTYLASFGVFLAQWETCVQKVTDWTCRRSSAVRAYLYFRKISRKHELMCKTGLSRKLRYALKSERRRYIQNESSKFCEGFMFTSRDIVKSLDCRTTMNSSCSHDIIIFDCSPCLMVKLTLNTQGGKFHPHYLRGSTPEGVLDVRGIRCVN